MSGLERLRWRGELLALADGTSTTSTHRAAERRTVSLAQTLAAAQVTRIPEPHVEVQLLALGIRLERQGGQLTAEQRAAVALACCERQLVMIEGQAGSGKEHHAGRDRPRAPSRRPTADRHQHCRPRGRAALGRARRGGRQRTRLLHQALHAAIESGRVVLDQHTTVIHDEAALASTREQQRLFAAVHASGARLIEVGDPRQSQAVGAGGLWPHLEQAAETTRRG